VATTNSVSGFIDRNGKVVARTNQFSAASMVVSMPLRTALTPAVVLAPWLGRGLALAGLVCCLVGLATRRGKVSVTGTGVGKDGPMQADETEPPVTADSGARR